jgi:RNA-binding protein
MTASMQQQASIDGGQFIRHPARGANLNEILPTETTSPRKRSLMPTGDLRRKLRAHGHPLHAIVRVGKSGVTAGLLAQVAQALFDHELIKVKIEAECPVDRFAVGDELAAQPGTQVVQIVGRTVLVYKRHPQKPRFEGVASRPLTAQERETAAKAKAAKAENARRPGKPGKPGGPSTRPSKRSSKGRPQERPSKGRPQGRSSKAKATHSKSPRRSTSSSGRRG